MNKILLNISLWALNFVTMYFNFVEWIQNNASLLNLLLLLISTIVSSIFIFVKINFHIKIKRLDAKNKDLQNRMLELEYDEKFRESLRDCHFD